MALGTLEPGELVVVTVTSVRAAEFALLMVTVTEPGLVKQPDPVAIGGSVWSETAPIAWLMMPSTA